MSIFESQTGKLAPQSVLIQRYLIVQLAGRGGMSAIYQALDMKSQQRVAIKEMSQENLSDQERGEAMKRFQQEAHLLGTLSHPNLPHIYDAFGAGGRSFLVMDFIEGKTLLQLLQEADRPLPVEQVLHYADQLCDVLMYLHQHNPPIIFRDLKPTNVMATKDGHVYLIDFGIARFFKEGQAQDTIMLGSPGYAPPEQHGIGQTNPRSDLYALGATLHCCLTNRDPYHAADRFTFAPVRQLNPQVPEALGQLIGRLLALDENQRPASAFEVKQALARIRQQMREQNSSGRMPAVSAPSSAPTQYVQPPARPVFEATQPVPGQTGAQERLILPATPALSANPAATQLGSPTFPVRPLASQTSARGRVWTPGFIVVFLLVLLLTVGGSLLTFNISHPYGQLNGAGLDHATETGLVILGLIVAVGMVVMTRSLMAVLVLFLSVAATLVSGFAFLVQTLRDMQPSAQILANLGQAQTNQFVTYGLFAAGIISLLWLLRRPFAWSDRIELVLLSGAICIFAVMQYSSIDTDVNKHLLLLAALIVFIQGILLAGQMERKRREI